MSIILDPHDGDLGMSAWVDCHDCARQPNRGAGWFAIRSGERHWIDHELHQHFHLECGANLVAAGLAQVRTVDAGKKTMAKAKVKPRQQVAR